MKILIFSIFFILLKEIINEYYEYKNLILNYSNPYYYISLKFENNEDKIDFIFSNYIPISFIPTLKCKICSKFKLNETNPNLVSIKQNINVPYYHYNYTSNIYNNIITIDNITSELDFIGFNNITYKSKFSDNGIFSLSYLNYNFNTTAQIFALKFTNTNSNCELHLGGYNSNYILNYSELKSFNVTIDDNNSTEQVLKSIWYIKFMYLFINNKKINNNINNTSDIKLSFDMGTDKFHIPKKYFFDNMHLIFPEKSHCQIHPDGYFICECNEDYKTNFGYFIFKNNNNEIFNIKTKDYIIYESGISSSTCIVKIKVNYENSLFIGGIGVLKNYYSIFNVENKTFLVFKEEEIEKISQFLEYFILFLFLFAFFCIAIFVIYVCCKRLRANHNNNDDSQGSINQGQGESSEETD